MAGDVVVVVVEHPGVEEGAQADEDTVSVGTIPWLVTDAGCMAIWLVIVLAPLTHQRVVAVLAPLEEVRLDLGNQNQDEEEEEDGMFASAA